MGIFRQISAIVGTKALAAPSVLENVPKGTDLSSANIDSAISTLLGNILTYAYTIVGIVSVVFVIYGGIQLILSSGNSEGLKKSKKTITYALGGLVLALMARAIKEFILGIR